MSEICEYRAAFELRIGDDVWNYGTVVGLDQSIPSVVKVTCHVVRTQSDGSTLDTIAGCYFSKWSMCAVITQHGTPGWTPTAAAQKVFGTRIYPMMVAAGDLSQSLYDQLKKLGYC